MYIPLYVKTDYSLLSSLIKIDNLINTLKNNNISSCAITDNNMFGTMEFIKKCEKANIKPIIGLDVNYKDTNILLYAKNLKGYQNLIKIETIKNENEITFDILKKYCNDIICICFIKEIFVELQVIFQDIYFGVKNLNEELENDFNKNIVYVNKTLYLERYEYKYLPYVFMIRDGKTINDGINFLYQDNYLKSYEEVSLTQSIDSINNTLKISDMCNISFNKKLYMPKYDVSNSKKYLVDLANKGLNKRLDNKISKEYQERLNYELQVIINMHFEDYFLVVYDYIKYAKFNNILVGPGRGSAAGSLVCYSLGITDVDPLKYNLLFERFLNKDRITMPDIDTDFPDVDREKVINYVMSKYGEKNVSGIITFGTLKAKQAIRDIGRILNIKMSDIDLICKKLIFNETLKDLRKRSREVADFLESDDKLKMLYNIALLIEDNKRHTSIHAAGMVISYKPLDEILPIIKSDSLYLTEYSMEYLEELGLIKMDFLGIKNLSIIKNIMEEVKQYQKINIDFNKIPLDDNETFALFRNGNTTGIFQFESEGMKRFLSDLNPVCLNDLISAIALYRPGPASNIPSFIKRKKGLEVIDYIDPSLKDILKETYGIIVYQEQIMQIANVMANYSLSEADLLRRAMSKKKLDILKHEEEKFLSNSISNGYDKLIAKKVYDFILKFANYGFNKSHSVAYSLVAYKMAYLKAHFPKYFYANLLEGVIGSETKTNEYLMEVKRLGLKVLSPDINKSLETKYIVEEDGIRLPFSSIRNVGGVIAQKIIEERKFGNYKDIFDFLVRIYKKVNNRKAIESLIYASCFNNLGFNITTLINNYEEINNYVFLATDLEEQMLEKPEIKIYNNDVDDILKHEKEIFGFYLTNHKTEKYKLQYRQIIDIKDIFKYFNKDVNVIVEIDKLKKIQTKNNETMLFITGTDNTSSISIIIFPKKYNEISNLNLEKTNIILINGKVEKRFNEYQIILNKMKKLEE